MLPITLYNPPPLACRSYDPRAPDVARALAELIHSVLADVQIEHFGSTAVPGCPGKGYIDLLVLYPDQSLETTRDGLAALGFQPQSSRDPFPEDRPMRVGSYDFDGREYSVHAHVVAMNSAEAEEFIWFRERLKADTRLREEYVAEKKRILTAGITDSVAYAYRKGTFVDRIMATREYL
jgi:GrpB-like predicted nucleotidyltransferase (UPF0157 family)